MPSSSSAESYSRRLASACSSAGASFGATLGSVAGAKVESMILGPSGVAPPFPVGSTAGTSIGAALGSSLGMMAGRRLDRAFPAEATGKREAGGDDARASTPETAKTVVDDADAAHFSLDAASGTAAAGAHSSNPLSPLSSTNSPPRIVRVHGVEEWVGNSNTRVVTPSRSSVARDGVGDCGEALYPRVALTSAEEVAYCRYCGRSGPFTKNENTGIVRERGITGRREGRRGKTKKGKEVCKVLLLRSSTSHRGFKAHRRWGTRRRRVAFGAAAAAALCAKFAGDGAYRQRLERLPTKSRTIVGPNVGLFLKMKRSQPQSSKYVNENVLKKKAGCKNRTKERSDCAATVFTKKERSFGYWLRKAVSDKDFSLAF